MSDSPRPFRVLGLQQVAIGGLERAPLRELWCELLGVELVGSYESEAENVREDILRVGPRDAAVEIDLMQPMDSARSPRVHEPALNHIGLWVDDLAAAYAYLSSVGVRFAPGGIRKGAAGHDVCFIHPKPSVAAPRSGQGVLIELVQAPAEVRSRFNPA
jgi:lactoylglutathione lyase